MPRSKVIHPGVPSKELANGVLPIEDAPTAITAFLGAALRGPVNQAVHVESFAGFQQRFGGLSTALELGYAVAQFFANGGQETWIVRIAQRPSARQMAKGLAALDRVERINLLALPGLTRRELRDAAIRYVEQRRAFFIADPPAEATAPAAMAALATSGFFPSEPSGAVFYPWLHIVDPFKPAQLRRTSPSGAVAGVIARTDAAYGIWKPPAGKEAVLREIAGLIPPLGDQDNTLLNPLGINCLRTFPGLGSVIWGARTLAGADVGGNSEWKYISVRRLVLHLEESIDRGTRWTVLEPNDEVLWAKVRRQVEEYLRRWWQAGALQGTKPEQAFFVRCDRTTMTQADIDSGRLVVEVGVAPVRPAEFVIFRIGQWKHDPE